MCAIAAIIEERGECWWIRTYVVNSPNQIREIRLFRVNSFDFIMFAYEMAACERSGQNVASRLRWFEGVVIIDTHTWVELNAPRRNQKCHKTRI